MQIVCRGFFIYFNGFQREELLLFFSIVSRQCSGNQAEGLRRGTDVPFAVGWAEGLNLPPKLL